MQAAAKNGSPTLDEWASFLSDLNGKKEAANTLLKKDETANRMIAHLEMRFPAVRKYRIGKQLNLFAHQLS